MLKTSNRQTTTISIPTGHRISSNYYPFGSSLPTRSWSDVSRAYRYGFNSCEKDEIFYNTEYRQYSPEIGRWCNVDPIHRSYESSYSSFSNSPIVMVDPSGNSDYYTLSGEYLGSDGTDNLDIIIVTDVVVIELIKKDRIANQNVPTYLLYDKGLDKGTYFVLPPYSDRQKIKAQMDACNNNQEIGGVGYSNSEGTSTFYAESVPGSKVNDEALKQNAVASLESETPSPFHIEIKALDEDALKTWKAAQHGTKVTFKWHYHPFRIVNIKDGIVTSLDIEDINSNQKTYGGTDGKADSNPSDPDKNNMIGKNYSAFIISKAAGTVTKYDANGVNGTMSADNFYNLQAKKKPE